MTPLSAAVLLSLALTDAKAMHRSSEWLQAATDRRVMETGLVAACCREPLAAFHLAAQLAGAFKQQASLLVS